MKTKEDQEEEGRKEGRRKLAVYEGLSLGLNYEGRSSTRLNRMFSIFEASPGAASQLKVISEHKQSIEMNWRSIWVRKENRRTLRKTLASAWLRSTETNTDAETVSSQSI